MARLGGHRPDVAAPGKGQNALRASCRSELGDDVAACGNDGLPLAPRRSDADEPIADRDRRARDALVAKVDAKEGARPGAPFGVAKLGRKGLLEDAPQ